MVRHQFSACAKRDVASGLVDPRLIAALDALLGHVSLDITVIKTNHPMGPMSPAGIENTHFFYRAADIVAVNGILVLENEDADELVRFGVELRNLPDDIRPDRIYGPRKWHDAIGYAPNFGFGSDPYHNTVHTDHIHVGYAPRSSGTPTTGGAP